MLPAKLTLASEPSALKAGHGRQHVIGRQQVVELGRTVVFEVSIELAGPDFDGAAIARGVIFDVLFQGRIERADLRHGGLHDRMRCSTSAPQSSALIRDCSSVSRSRMVTVASCRVWPSTVMQNGVPASSWRR